ncbi:MAG: amidohydrolase [Betaproteobacteria bacterium]|nr:amidohydrolase [Betaproteobacteria bacterium]
MSTSARIREQLSHPVIDSDGHSIDFGHIYQDYLREAGGPQMAARYAENLATLTNVGPRWYRATPEARRAERIPRPAWWAVPSGNALDLATAKLPKLLYERLPEAGIDVTVLFAGTIIIDGLFIEAEVRRAACRASNRLHMDMFRDYADRLIPVASIPAHTPQEAIAELDYCVNELGYRAFTMPSYIKRPVPAHRGEFPRTFWFDTYGIDSAYDYDPLWACCLALGVVPTFHSSSQGLGFRASVSNFTYNHIGHFAQSAEAVCKSLFMGGVTHRFPGLRFGFLEGGTAWAAALFADLLGHWKKRNPAALVRVDPARMDRAAFLALCREHGAALLGDALRPEFHDQLVGSVSTNYREDRALHDEFALTGVSCPEDMLERFVKPFYFGCEGDDPMTGVAFDPRRNPLRTRLNAVFGSDIGHFDVPNIAAVLEETWEPVERGDMDWEDFRAFVFGNPARMWAGQNPHFFRGTSVESAVTALLDGEGA